MLNAKPGQRIGQHEQAYKLGRRNERTPIRKDSVQRRRSCLGRTWAGERTRETLQRSCSTGTVQQKHKRRLLTIGRHQRSLEKAYNYHSNSKENSTQRKTSVDRAPNERPTAKRASVECGIQNPRASAGSIVSHSAVSNHVMERTIQRYV